MHEHYFEKQRGFRNPYRYLSRAQAASPAGELLYRLLSMSGASASPDWMA